MCNMISLLLGLITLAVMVIFIVIAAILIGMFFTGLIGGSILLFTGNKLSIDTKKKVLSRVCIVIGIVLLLMAGGSAGIIIAAVKMGQVFITMDNIGFSCCRIRPVAHINPVRGYISSQTVRRLDKGICRVCNIWKSCKARENIPHDIFSHFCQGIAEHP